MNLSDFDIYVFFCTSGIGNRKIHRLLNSGIERFEGFEKTLMKDPGEIALILKGLGNKDVESLKSLDLEAVRAEYDLLLSAGVDIISAGSGIYPDALNEQLESDAPALLFCLGKLELILKPAVAIVGSRHASDQGAEFADRLVEGLKDTRLSIISGGALGIDMAAHRSAFEHGLETVVVLAHGINHILKRRESEEVLKNILFMSQFHPESGWSAARAMIRNKTICALSSAIFVVEAGESGGTINTGETALEMGVPLYVISPDEFKNPPSGNRHLISRGGRELFLDSVHESLDDVDN